MSSPDLNLAIAAAASGRWSAAIDYLRQMPIDRQIDRFQVLDLALQVLIQGDFEEQWEIAKIIPKLGEIAIQPLLELIDREDIEEEERWFIARILGDLVGGDTLKQNRPDVIAKLVELARQHEDLDLQSIAADALAKIGTPAIAMLADLIDTPACAMAVNVLARIRHSQTIEPLILTLDHPDPQLRTLTVEALGSFHDPRIPPILGSKLTDVAPSVRQAAVTALCLRSDLAIELHLVQQIRPLLFDLSLAVCKTTALSLARINDPSVIDVLAEVLASPHTPAALRSEVILALGWIGTRSAIASLAQILITAPPALAQEILISIGNTERERDYASQAIVDYWRSNHAGHSAIVTQEIATALGNLGNPDAIATLIGLLGDPDDRVKLYTIAAIAKLSSTIPPEILQLVDRSDLPSSLQHGVRMCLSHWENMVIS